MDGYPGGGFGVGPLIRERWLREVPKIAAAAVRIKGSTTSDDDSNPRTRLSRMDIG